MSSNRSVRELPCPFSKVRIEVASLGEHFHVSLKRPNMGFAREMTLSLEEASTLYELLEERLFASGLG